MESMVQKELDDMELENSKLKEELLKKTEEIVQLRSADICCNGSQKRRMFGTKLSIFERVGRGIFQQNFIAWSICTRKFP